MPITASTVRTGKIIYFYYELAMTFPDQRTTDFASWNTLYTHVHANELTEKQHKKFKIKAVS
jgi:hypothetical protein